MKQMKVIDFLQIEFNKLDQLDKKLKAGVLARLTQKEFETNGTVTKADAMKGLGSFRGKP